MARVPVRVLKDFIGTREERMEFGNWRQQRTIMSLRPDGEPNIIHIEPRRFTELVQAGIVAPVDPEEAPPDPGPPPPAAPGPSIMIRKEQPAAPAPVVPEPPAPASSPDMGETPAGEKSSPGADGSAAGVVCPDCDRPFKTEAGMMAHRRQAHGFVTEEK